MRFSKPIEEIFQELNARLYVSTHLRGLQLQKFIYEIRTSGHNVCFLRSAPHNKTSVNVHSYYASRCKLGVQTLALNTFLSKIVTRTPGLALSVLKRLRRNSAQHKRKPFLIASFADDCYTTQQNSCTNVHNYYASR